MNNHQKVVIIGNSPVYTSRLSLVRSLSQIGCEITIVALAVNGDKKKPLDCYSKYVSQYFLCEAKNERNLVRLLLDKCVDEKQKVILLPDNDGPAAIIDDYYEELKCFFVIPRILHGRDSVRYWMSKENQKKVATQVGLNVTKARVVDVVDGHYSIPQDICYPCFPKPFATEVGGKRGMRKCSTPADLQNSIDNIIGRANNVRVLVEDYKEIDEEYAVCGFSDGANVVIPAVLQLIAVSKRFPGIATQGKIMPVDGFEDLIEKFKHLVVRIGFVGVFDIDFFKSGDLFYFCELNLRWGGSGYAYTKMGVNLPAMFVYHVIGQDYQSLNSKVESSAVYANERTCLEDWYNGYISFKEYSRLLDSADIRFVPDPDDKSPEHAYRKYVIMLVMKRFVRTLLVRR